jgi:hypothetical protein
MVSATNLGKTFIPKGCMTCHIPSGPVSQYKFNHGVCLVIGLTCYGNSSEVVCMYMFLTLFFNPISTPIMIR